MVLQDIEEPFWPMYVCIRTHINIYIYTVYIHMKIISILDVYVIDTCAFTCAFTCEEVKFFRVTKDKFPNFLWEIVY